MTQVCLTFRDTNVLPANYLYIARPDMYNQCLKCNEFRNLLKKYGAVLVNTTFEEAQEIRCPSEAVAAKVDWLIKHKISQVPENARVVHPKYFYLTWKVNPQQSVSEHGRPYFSSFPGQPKRPEQAV